jgi:tRNA(Ile)-lysidine synthase
MTSKINTAKQTLIRVKATISRFEMIQRNDRVIVAVSGGADSISLLHLLHALRDLFSMHLVVAHYEHGLRPMEDPAETGFVQQFAVSLGLPFESEKGALSTGRGGSIEERARNARYDFLERMREKHKAQRIALGHTLNDQAETLLMRLLRGSGPAGLGSIPPVRNSTIIRPLIETERREIEAYLASQGLAWKTDSSNLQPTYLRNRIRLELIPLLENYQPRLVKLLGQTSAILRDENACLEKIAEAWLTSKVDMKPEGSFRISIPSLLELPVALRRRVTRQLIGKVKKDLRRISSDHIESAEKLMRAEKPQRSLSLPNSVKIKRAYDHLIFSAEPGRKLESFSYNLDGPGEHPLEEIGRLASIFEMPNSMKFPVEGSPWTAFFDAEKVHYPLTLRSFRPGDRFVPLGMTGHKKLKDFFVDLKIPRDQRYSTPILCCDNIPVWVCGFRIDDRFKVTPETKRVMKVMLDPASKI